MVLGVYLLLSQQRDNLFSFSLISESEVKLLPVELSPRDFYLVYALLVFRIGWECFYNPVISGGKNQNGQMQLWMTSHPPLHLRKQLRYLRVCFLSCCSCSEKGEQ